MKKLIASILLLSSLSAMAKDIYLDCKLGTTFSEGFRESKVILIDGKLTANNGKLCFNSLIAKTRTTTCTYGWCGEEDSAVSTDEVKNCYETETLAMSHIIETVCKKAIEVEAEIGTRKVEAKPESEVDPEGC